MEASKMPLTGKVIADTQAKERQQQMSQPDILGVGRSFSGESLGVSVTSPQKTRIVRLNKGANPAEIELVIHAIYSQVMDLFSSQVPAEYRHPDLESSLRNGLASVRGFVKAVASSEFYEQRFCLPYPQAKAVELLFRHLLGRTPETQTEIQHYGKLLNEQGLPAAVEAILDSAEYARFFGENVVPYNRFPTLSVSNYPGSVKAISDQRERG
ncbi:phycobilisome rod-core linker polypeptide [Lyngbya aestuarii]|uniref:phycobilisome rod-core linker polypeptide n=1 Tax=Lyngbya aestuarii TaxID=118322 RepID=UPI00403E2E2C